jgi:hypothetical protein
MSSTPRKNISHGQKPVKPKKSDKPELAGAKGRLPDKSKKGGSIKIRRTGR